MPFRRDIIMNSTDPIIRSPDDVSTMATVFTAIHCSTGTIGILANLFVFYCIFCKSQNSIREYRILLANSAITDLICTSALLFLQPRLIPHVFVFIYIAEGPAKLFGPQVAYYAYCIVLNMIFYTFFSFPFSFGYRYYVLVRRPPTQQRLICICLGLYSIAFCQLILFINSQSPTDHIRNYVEKHLPEIDITNEVVSGNDGARDPLTFVTLFLICVPMFPIYIIVIIIRRRVHRMLDGGSFSDRTKQAHRSLILALTVHAALPVCFIFPPILIYACYHLVPCLRFHFIEFLVFTMFAWTHMFNPFVTIYFVRPYNRAARHMFFFWKRGAIRQGTETSMYPSSISYAGKNPSP
ncbi:hypothetical protein QR680_011644 [Steinernema hermaphroditum]|uniref:G-protein coupled receptors family 1 profile domain-containing protein n=1 Tax=Steinernema hermaphroditum TaxID=289476 RepID=A0AA39LZB1_9BILA|nr:hypothetical protein QR680_011644 [Steinernema hermaphroditum]